MVGLLSKFFMSSSISGALHKDIELIEIKMHVQKAS